jgi:hypothetical protein
MALSADISIRLDAGALVSGFVGSLGGNTSALGAIAVPDTEASTAQIDAAAGSFDAAGLAPAIARLVEQGGAALAALGVPVDPLASLKVTLELVEQASAGNLRAELETLIADLTLELEGSREGGTFAVLMRLAQRLGQAPQGGVLVSLLQSLLGTAGVQVPPAVGEVSTLLPALDSLVRALGALMMLESVLSESQRLTEVMSQRLDAGAVQRSADGLLALFDPALAARIAATDPADEAALAALLSALEVGAARIGELAQELSAGMGLGEATLAYLDVATVQAEVETAATLLRNIDLAPLERQLRAALGGLAPFMTLDFASVPPQSLDALLAQAEAQIGSMAGQIGAFDPAFLVAPMSRGIDQLSAPLADLSGLIGEAVASIGAALDAVRRVVIDLPLGELAGAVTTLLQPVADALQAIAALVAEVAAALETAAAAALAALGEVEGLVDGFKQQIEALFAEARQFVDGLNLDSIAGELTDRIAEFTQALSRADMKPIFDTAVGAIGSASDVVEAVPFGLLPESMKADVDAAVKPIKDTDLSAVQTQVESLLGIGADGSFAPRADLEVALAEIQAKFDALMLTLREHDPEQYLAQLDEELAKVAEQISKIAPAIALQPVQDVIDDLKATVAGFDLGAQLAPLQQVFDDAIAALQPYSPAQLITPLTQRVTEARQKVIDTLQLEQWAPALDTVAERAQFVLGLIDPAQLETQITELLTQARGLTQQLPDTSPAWLGTVIAALHRGSGARVYPWAFPVVQSWIDAGAGAAALTARTTAIADAVARTHAAVERIDVVALTGQLSARAQPLRAALDSLAAAVAAASPHKERLVTLSLRLDVQASLGPIAANRGRYLALLEAALPLGATLRRTGLSEVDTTLVKLRSCFEPVASLLGTLRAFLGAAGLADVHRGVPRMIDALFEVAPPARLAALTTPLFVALRGRVQALIDAVIAPLKIAIARLSTLIAAIDLAPLEHAVNAVFQETLAQVQALSPATLLAAPIAAVDTLKAEVAAFDPLAALLTLLDSLRDSAARVLTKLSAQQLLADPLAIYREIVDALDALNVQALMAPVLDLLDAIARDVGEGLDDTLGAFQRLQDALPSGGGGSSVSVEVVV